MPGDAAKGLQFKEAPIFERGSPGRSGASLGDLDVPAIDSKRALSSLARKSPAGLEPSFFQGLSSSIMGRVPSPVRPSPGSLGRASA